MTLPTCHTNGTSARSLCEGYCTARSAVDDAIEEVQKNGPNGRDYYPQGTDALTAAIREHRERLTRLQIVREELETLAQHCSDFIKP